jgi:hypothetical protein
MASNAAAIGFLSLLGRRYRARRQRVTDHGFATDDVPQGKPGDRRHSGIDRMVERAASRHRSVKPEAANGGGPKGQALQTDGGEQTIELAIGQRAQRRQRRLRRFAMGPALRDLCAHRQNH